MKPTVHALLVSGLFFGLFSATACTETSKDWVRSEKPLSDVDRASLQCQTWAEASAIHTGDEEKTKGNVKTLFQRCMKLNGYKEQETVEYK
ncbi:MAG TPA: hypothetical protein PKI49_05680 [Pseudomonadota bacterium]|jgi:hypothetical protein|nr:hypothetical protein [Pseudomonadota bacterium]HNF98160.1 hypothetical protein [Pseudomonadota bacterium]HNI59031.1 hypothetical protein [Pseudomonadota bacterium]HNK46497.1 hypothetical protein [Pseudomonadota bacterium]HNN49612.1 hypothetical protein [Pseudomonadota bacterium]